MGKKRKGRAVSARPRDSALARAGSLGYHCGMRALLLPLLLVLAAPAAASDCDPRQAVGFSDGSRVCLHDRPSLPMPTNRQTWRPAFNGLYSLAASLDAACPVALGVGTNINSPLPYYAERRDSQALEQCQGELRRLAAPAACRCDMLIKDGSSLIERSEFDAWVARTLPAPAGVVAAAPTSPPQALPHGEPEGPPTLAAPAAASKPASSPITAPPSAVAAPASETQPPPAAPTASEPRTFSATALPAPKLQAARVERVPRLPLAASPAPVTASAPSLPPPVVVAAPTLAPRRALVVGNRDYVVGRLKNPVNDARAMAAQLRELRFQTTLVENLRRDEIGRVVDGFLASVQPGDDVVLFYAGHGLQIRGANYLPAVDAQIRGESDVPLNSIHLNALLERLDEARAGVRLLLIDACRDNPYARSYRSGAVGLARIDAAPAGTLIHFATRPGGVSADGEGEHGLYTKHLLQHLRTPDLPVEQMLKRVASAVRRESGNAQLPWTEGSLDGDFYFVPPVSGSR